MALMLNTLYPPIMMDVIPGFIRTSTCRIYFSISDYNSAKDIANVQVALTNVKTNTSALNTDLYPAEIKLTELLYDDQKQDDYCYYITISPADLAGGEFLLNQYYKIQLRFTSKDADSVSLTGVQQIATWLNNNLMFFSQWSRAGIIRGISRPTLYIDYLDDEDEEEEEESENISLSAPLSKITGRLTFADEGELDYLASYNVKVYLSKQDNKLIFDSGIQHPIEENEIDCNLLCDLQDQRLYMIKISYTTNYAYSKQENYIIQVRVESQDLNPFNLTITPTRNEEDGYINLHITMDKTKDFSDKQLLIRRISSKDNFLIWENLYAIDQSFSTFDWQDLSVESGIWYKYALYVVDLNKTILYNPIETDPILCIFEDIFLVSDNIQLRLQFNPSITSFKYNTTESQQVTLGGKFPYIRRNGNNYYRTFSIGGLISSLMDETDWYDSYIHPPHPIQGEEEQKEEITLPHIRFTSKQDKYKDSYDLYQQYESDKNISNYLNPIYERFFRETVYDFFYKNSVKLFKSPTEGNILVKLTNINFEPQAQLGRVLYSFTATAVQIDEPTFENYKKYKIFPDDIFEYVTESPALEIEFGTATMVLVINANGASQNGNQNWALHLEPYPIKGGG